MRSSSSTSVDERGDASHACDKFGGVAGFGGIGVLVVDFRVTRRGPRTEDLAVIGGIWRWCFLDIFFVLFFSSPSFAKFGHVSRRTVPLGFAPRLILAISWFLPHLENLRKRGSSLVKLDPNFLRVSRF